LAIAVVGFATRTLTRHWDEFRALDVEWTLNIAPLALAAITVWVTYAILIEAWRRVVIGWGQLLPYPTAARIWCLSNMGRYLPGKVWSIAGLAVLAQRAGVSGWAATGSAVAMQALALGTGASVVAVAAPQAVSPLQLLAAGVMAVGVVWLLVSGDLSSRLARAIRPGAELKPLSFQAAIAAGAATLVGWLAYGVAFWLLARGLIPEADLSLRIAVGVFAAGYILGLVAIFAPGGLGVRELVFVAILAPRVGSGGAVALAISSRLLLTITEIVAASIALLLVRGKKEKTIDGS
jgi:uncharacterized membrane protein YbhN (UPF0104 family)